MGILACEWLKGSSIAQLGAQKLITIAELRIEAQAHDAGAASL